MHEYVTIILSNAQEVDFFIFFFKPGSCNLGRGYVLKIVAVILWEEKMILLILPQYNGTDYMKFFSK